MTDPKPERRGQKRLPVRLPVSIKSPEGAEAPGQTRDLSARGVFLFTDSEVTEGSELELVLVLPPELTGGEKRWVCCQASVVRVEKGAEGGGYGVAASLRTLEALPEIVG